MERNENGLHRLRLLVTVRNNRKKGFQILHVLAPRSGFAVGAIALGNHLAAVTFIPTRKVFQSKRYHGQLVFPFLLEFVPILTLPLYTFFCVFGFFFVALFGQSGAGHFQFFFESFSVTVLVPYGQHSVGSVFPNLSILDMWMNTEKDLI